MKKRGQVTLFIILGILILAAVILVLYLRSRLSNG
jgi:predicted nucleic acid-binding Zn ribbon protein